MEYQFCMELVTPVRSYFLIAKNAKEQLSWATTLTSLCGVVLLTPDKEIIVEGKARLKVKYAKHGYMKKRGANNTAYQTRFMRTQENAKGEKILIYYENFFDSKPKGFIPLKNAIVKDGDWYNQEKALRDSKKGNVISLCITVVTDQRSFFLECMSYNEKQQWMDVLTSIVSGTDGSATKTIDLLNKQDLYSILGVPAKSSPEQISSAYKELAVKLHPDKNSDPRAAEEFQKVKEAYDTLMDPVSKRAYDNTIKDSPCTPSATNAQKVQQPAAAAAASTPASDDNSQTPVKAIAPKSKISVNIDSNSAAPGSPDLFSPNSKQAVKLAVTAATGIKDIDEKASSTTSNANVIDIDELRFRTELQSPRRPSAFEESSAAADAVALGLAREKELEEARIAAKAKQDALEKEKEEKLRMEAEAQKKSLQVLSQGVSLWKLPRSGWSSPAQNKFYIYQESDGKYVLRWDSKSKSQGDDKIPLSKANTYVKGFKAGLWRANVSYQKQFSKNEKMAFTITTASRSLDLCSDSVAEFEHLDLVLSKICQEQVISK
jgi:curved DNA-binding protein CbpA